MAGRPGGTPLHLKGWKRPGVCSQMDVRRHPSRTASLCNLGHLLNVSEPLSSHLKDSNSPLVDGMGCGQDYVR